MSGPEVRASRFGGFASGAVLLVVLSLMAIHGKAADGTASTAGAKATFSSKCAMCHGPNGGGSDVGKSLNVPDLRSSPVQKKTNSELEEVIANGKNAMPPFKGSLNAGQIHGLVAYIRTFASKK